MKVNKPLIQDITVVTLSVLSIYMANFTLTGGIDLGGILTVVLIVFAISSIVNALLGFYESRLKFQDKVFSKEGWEMHPDEHRAFRRLLGDVGMINKDFLSLKLAILSALVSPMVQLVIYSARMALWASKWRSEPSMTDIYIWFILLAMSVSYLVISLKRIENVVK